MAIFRLYMKYLVSSYNSKYNIKFNRFMYQLYYRKHILYMY